MQDDRDGWIDQYKWDRDKLLDQISEISNKHDKLCDEVVKIKINQAISSTRIALIAAGVAFAAGILGSLVLGTLKHLPAILKTITTTPKP